MVRAAGASAESAASVFIAADVHSLVAQFNVWGAAVEDDVAAEFQRSLQVRLWKSDLVGYH